MKLVVYPFNSNPDYLYQYKRLLHDVYRYECKWDIVPGNMSDLRYTEQNTIDDIFFRQSVCFMIIDKEKVIAGTRLILRNTHLETEVYPNFFIHKKKLGQELESAIEYNRSVVHPDYRGKLLHLILDYHVFRFCRKNSIKYIMGTADSKVFIQKFKIFCDILDYNFEFNKGESPSALIWHKIKPFGLSTFLFCPGIFHLIILWLRLNRATKYKYNNLKKTLNYQKPFKKLFRLFS